MSHAGQITVAREAELTAPTGVALHRLVRHRRRTIWSRVKDFMQDNNATMDFQIVLGNGMPPINGTCGMKPDEAMMASEPISRFDILADAMGWDIQTRKIEYWIWEKLGKTKRIAWLENQVVESLKTESAPMSEMTPEETAWFLREISTRKVAREKYRKYEKQRRIRDGQPMPNEKS